MHRYARLSISLLAALAVLSSVLLVACSDDDEPESIILATTTSTQDSGLLDVLLPLFQDDTGIEVKPIAVGTGAALEMSATGDADVVLVHAPDAEQEYVDSGDLIDGQFIMYNDFVIVGPPDDPAGLAGAADLAAALGAIAASGPFTSRGDDSGTHKKELALWEAAGIDPASVPNREETGQGMGATLNVANQKQAYTLTDRATFLALQDDLDLEIIFENDPNLYNPYHIYLVNPEQHDGVHEDEARELIDFFISEAAQDEIRTFGEDEYGQPLFVPTAGMTMEEVFGSGQ